MRNATPSIWRAAGGRGQAPGERRDLRFGQIGTVNKIGRVQVPAVEFVRGPVEERVTRAAVELDWIVVKRLVEQARTVLVKDTDPEVHPVLQNRALDLVRRQRVEVNVDPPGLGPERAKHVGQWIAALCGPVVDRGDREVADQLAAQRAHGGTEALQRGRKVLARLVDDPSLVGKPESSPPPLAKAHAKAGLQIADLAADGRLPDVQGNLRRGESAAVRYRHEDREQVQIGLVEAGRSGCDRFWHT